PMLWAGLLVAATGLSIQSAFRDRGTTVAPPVSAIDQGANLQKAGMTEAGITSLAGTSEVVTGHMANHVTDVQAREGTSVLPKEKPAGPDEALQATIDRIEQA